jgi:DNA helicase-2/ATP-dependent DNA helicase PcrA
MKLDIFTIDKFCNMLKFRYLEQETDNKFRVDSLTELCVIGEKIMEKYGKEISNHYTYIFFDEFQDVNKQQFNILKIFADNGCILTVIGDDNQNIYQFRGTDNYYIIHFDKIIHNTKTFQLTTNYRSSNEIVSLANKSIEGNQHKLEKNMDGLYNSDKLPKLYLFQNTNEECKYILKTIKKQMKKFNLEYDDFAILCRNGFPLKDFETFFVNSILLYYHY